MVQTREASRRLRGNHREEPGWRRPWIWIAVIVGALALQIFIEGPTGLLWSAVFDAGHAPLFGLIALAFLRVTPSIWPGIARGARRRYSLAFTFTAFLGAFTETVQLIGARDADPWDFVRDVLGAGAFLLAHVAWEHRAFRLPRNVAVLGGAALLLCAFWPLMSLAVAFAQRDSAAPHICDFDHHWEYEFLYPCNADMAFVTAPSGWPRESSRDRVGRFTLRPVEYPGFEIVEPYPDWQGYDHLVFEAFSLVDSTIDLRMRVSDDRHNHQWEDRFNRKLSIHPGRNRISVALSDVERAPRDRRMDMSAIRNITFFAVEPSQPLTIYLDAIHLE